MPAWAEEKIFALSQGISIQTLVGPIEFEGEEGRLTAVKCVKMDLGEKDISGRRRPIPISDSEFKITCNSAVLALGQGPTAIPGELEKDMTGLVKVDDDTMETSVPGIYAGGDLVRGSSTAVQAVGDGKRAAFAMDIFVKEST